MRAVTSIGWVGIVVLAAMSILHRTPKTPTDVDLPTHLRRPVALVPLNDGNWLYVANRRSGTISVIDTAKSAVIAEVRVGHKLADLASDVHGRRLFALDEGTNELLRLSIDGPKIEILDRLPISGTPVRLTMTSDGKRCVVASLWGRFITVVAINDNLRFERGVDVPFNPREVLLIPDTAKCIVADAFGGKLGVVDIERGTLDSLRELPAHNMRGLALSTEGDTLFISHQNLASLAQTTRDDIHWGNLLTNNVRGIPLADLLNPKADLLSRGQLFALGEVGRGTGDPAGATILHNRLFIALAGVDEVAVGRGGSWTRQAVGRNPTRIVAAPNRDKVYLANTFDDSVSVIDPSNLNVSTITLGRQPALGESERGQLLFHDARLSHDGWLSCHSCHTDGHTNGQLNDNLGDGSFGAPKRVLSLLGVKDTGPWAWNGAITDLETQVAKSIRTTMHGPSRAEEQELQQAREITAFLQTLTPPPPRPSIVDDALERGRNLFEEHSCTTCHAPPTYTSLKTYDIGLLDEVGNTRFNPPSLRGIAHGGPFFHDNRAASLHEVFSKFRHQLKQELSPLQLADLLTFLGSL